MKVIVSSKTLHTALKGLCLGGYSIKEVSAENGLLTFTTDNKTSHLHCEIESDMDKVTIAQYNRRWDWVCEIVKCIPEQPVVLNITKNNVRISMDC